MDRRRRRSEVVAQMLGADNEQRTAWARLEELYRDNRDDLYAYVFTLLRDSAAAEDVTALAFERAFRRRRTFDRHRGEERPWLFGIARNAALDELRRRRRVAALVIEPEAASEQPEPFVDDEDVVLRRTAVRAAMQSMSARDREVLALKFHAGLTNAELAAVLGVSESNAGTILHRTVQKLRKAVNAQI